MVEPKPLEAASTERSTSAEVDLTLALTSLEAATRAFCALVALAWIAVWAVDAAFWIASVDFEVTAARPRSMSVEIALIWLAASAEVDANDPCASRALPRMAAAV